MLADIRSTIRLNNGVEMPRFGLGVYLSAPGAEAYQAVKTALELGYRHIDTASLYGNEADVGRAIRDAGVPRDEVFVASKVWNADQGYERTLRSCRESLRLLGFERLDLYLIHWPRPETRRDTWRAMEKLAQEGLCRAVGVSNYTTRHLDELLADATIVPAVNQVEFHPFLYQKALLEYCRGKGIVLEAYSPLTHGERLDDPRLASIAAKHGKSVAQVLIRWVLQHDMVVIPKSVHRKRLAENADVFDFALDAADMAALDAMNEDLRTCWDPSDLP